MKRRSVHRIILVTITALAACQTAPKLPVAMSPTDVATLSDDEPWDFAVGADGSSDDETLSLRIMSPLRCPRGERVVTEGRPEFAFALERCDEEAGERMLFSVDAITVSKDGEAPFDARARIEIPPSTAQAQVPLSSLEDALTISLDATRSRALLRGEMELALLAEGNVVHRINGRSHDYGRRKVRIRGVDHVVSNISTKVAAKTLPPDDPDLPRTETPVVDQNAYVTDSVSATDAARFVALVAQRCRQGHAPILAVTTTTGEILVMFAPRGAPVACTVGTVPRAELARHLASLSHPPQVAASYGDDVIVVVVDAPSEIFRD